MLISIIVPFYYGNKYIENTCSTISKNVQYLKEYNNYCGIECIIVNDSPDEEVSLLKDKYDFPIKICIHEKNFGIQQARITGLNNANGEYIIFLDQDDELIEDAIYQEIKNVGNADLLVCNAYMEDKNGNLSKLYKTKGSLNNVKQLEAYLYGHNRIASPGQCLIKKSAIPSEWKLNILEVNGSDDLFLWILMFEKHSVIKSYDRVVYIHKYTGENLSEDPNKMTKSTLGIVKILNTISYVDLNTVKKLKKDRFFSEQLYKKKGLKRIIIILKNLDVIINRVNIKFSSIF